MSIVHLDFFTLTFRCGLPIGLEQPMLFAMGFFAERFHPGCGVQFLARFEELLRCRSALEELLHFIRAVGRNGCGKEKQDTEPEERRVPYLMRSRWKRHES